MYFSIEGKGSCSGELFNFQIAAHAVTRNGHYSGGGASHGPQSNHVRPILTSQWMARSRFTIPSQVMTHELGQQAVNSADKDRQ
jgi:hypothetical protein